MRVNSSVSEVFWTMCKICGGSGHVEALGGRSEVQSEDFSAKKSALVVGSSDEKELAPRMKHINITVKPKHRREI